MSGNILKNYLTNKNTVSAKKNDRRLAVTLALLNLSIAIRAFPAAFHSA